jgi:hypothetical protein
LEEEEKRKENHNRIRIKTYQNVSNYTMNFFKTIIKYIKLIPKATPQDVRGVFQGYWRYLGYWIYSFYKKKCLPKFKSPYSETDLVDEFEELNYLPKHVREQIRYRLNMMNETCILKGECPCQCLVPYKQFENRSCEKNCYPELMEEKQWADYKTKNNITNELITEGFKRYYQIKSKNYEQE